MSQPTWLILYQPPALASTLPPAARPPPPPPHKALEEMKVARDAALNSTELGKELKTAQDEVHALRDQETALTAENTKLQRDVDAAIEKDKLDDKAVADLAAAQVELAKAKEDVAALEAKITTIDSQHADEAKDKSKETDAHKAALEAAEKTAAQLQQDLAKYKTVEEGAHKAEAQLAEATAKMDELTKQAKDADGKVKEADQHFKQLQKTHAEQLQNQTKNEAKLAKLTQDNEDLTKQLEARKGLLDKKLEGHELGDELKVSWLACCECLRSLPLWAGTALVPCLSPPPPPCPPCPSPAPPPNISFLTPNNPPTETARRGSQAQEEAHRPDSQELRVRGCAQDHHRPSG